MRCSSVPSLFWFRTSTIFLVISAANSAGAVDPLATHLPWERLPAKKAVFRAIQSNRLVYTDQYRFSLGLSWNPELLSGIKHRLAVDIGVTLVPGALSDSNSNPENHSPFLANHLKLIYERRLSEAFSLEMGPGYSIWSNLGDSLFKTRPAAKSASGFSLTFRLIDRFFPAIDGKFDRWSFGVAFENMKYETQSLQFELAAGIQF